MSKKYQFNHIKQYAQEGLTFQERPEFEPNHQHPPTYPIELCYEAINLKMNLGSKTTEEYINYFKWKM